MLWTHLAILCLLLRAVLLEELRNFPLEDLDYAAKCSPWFGNLPSKLLGHHFCELSMTESGHFGGSRARYPGKFCRDDQEVKPQGNKYIYCIAIASSIKNASLTAEETKDRTVGIIICT